MGANQEVNIEIFANGGNYDTFKVLVDSGSNGTKFQDLPSGGGYDTWMSVATSPNTSSLGDITLNRKTNITKVMNLSSQNPLPAGTIGDLAVSGSNLFFYNGAWTQVI